MNSVKRIATCLTALAVFASCLQDVMASDRVSKAKAAIRNVLVGDLNLRDMKMEIDDSTVAVSFRTGKAETIVVRTQMEAAMLAGAIYAPWTQYVVVGLHAADIPVGYVKVATADVKALVEEDIDVVEFRSKWEIVRFPPLVSEVWELLWPVIYSDERLSEASMTACSGSKMLKNLGRKKKFKSEIAEVASAAFCELKKPYVFAAVIDLGDYTAASGFSRSLLEQGAKEHGIEVVQYARYVYLLKGDGAIVAKAMKALELEDVTADSGLGGGSTSNVSDGENAVGLWSGSDVVGERKTLHLVPANTDSVYVWWDLSVKKGAVGSIKITRKDGEKPLQSIPFVSSGALEGRIVSLLGSSWQPGKYRIDVLFEDSVLASETFVIISGVFAPVE